MWARSFHLNHDRRWHRLQMSGGAVRDTQRLREYSTILFKLRCAICPALIEMGNEAH